MTASYLKNGPLQVCLAVFRFSPIELMGKEYIARIQDVFRKHGLPKFTEQEAVEIGNKGERKVHVQWLFSSYDDSELVVIGTSSVTYQTFAYSHFEAFKERLLKLFGLFCRVTDFYQGTVLNFFGLRYANAIEGNDWKEYLSSSYHGIVFPQNLVDAASHQYLGLYAQGVTDMSEDRYANLVVKTVQNGQGLLYPPDIILLKQPVIREGVMVTLLDIEHFMVLDCQPENSTFIDQALDQLHDGCERVFMEAITEKAKRKWK